MFWKQKQYWHFQPRHLRISGTLVRNSPPPKKAILGCVFLDYFLNEWEFNTMGLIRPQSRPISGRLNDVDLWISKNTEISTILSKFDNFFFQNMFLVQNPYISFKISFLSFFSSQKCEHFFKANFEFWQSIIFLFLFFNEKLNSNQNLPQRQPFCFFVTKLTQWSYFVACGSLTIEQAKITGLSHTFSLWWN
jgi:hypothetical protein